VPAREPADRRAPAARADAASRDGAGATAWVAAGAVVGGLAAYVFQILGTRALGPEDYAAIGVLWTFQYLIVAVGLTAVEAYVTRTVAEHGPDAPGTLAAQRVLVGWLAIGAVLLGAIGVLFRDRLFGGLWDLGLVLGLLVLSYGSFTIARGRTAGSGRFRGYGLATAGESVVRLGAAAAVLTAVTSTRSLAWVFPLGPAVVTLWALARRRHRQRARVVAGTSHLPTVAAPALPAASPSRFLAHTVTANAAVQLLLAAGPLALVVLGASAREVSVFFTTVTIVRAPMTLVLGGGLARALPPLLRLARTDAPPGTSPMRRPVLLTVTVSVAVATIGGAVAWLVGPPLIALLFGDAFRPTALLAAVATVGVVLTIGGLGLDQILIAAGREAELPRHWLGGVLLAVVLVLVLPLDVSHRVIVASTAGTALAVVTLALRAVSPPR
jgi:O-antigen/teichoic acid export membrane protein